VQRHWFRLVRSVAPLALILTVLFVLFYTLALTPGQLYQGVALFLTLPMLAVIAGVWWQYINWHDDMFILTTQRVVHIEREWPIKEHFEESAIENIEDIYEVRPGLTANVLNYGNLILQTAGETVKIDMLEVGNPDALRELIFREIERLRAREVLQARGALYKALAQRLDVKYTPPAEPLSIPTTPQERPPLVRLIIRGLGEYLFPPSWAVSADGNTIIWRRYFFPGFIRYLEALVPLLLITGGGGYFLIKNAANVNFPWMLALWMFVETLLIGGLLWFIEDWRNDYFELTPHHIILIERNPLMLKESRKEASLDRIQNISFEIPSIFARYLKYGHVTLETAGTLGKFQMKWIRYPQKVQAEISQRQRQFKQQQKDAEAQRRQDELLSWFATYDGMRKK